MLDLMQTELEVIAHTVSAGKWDRSQNLYEPPGGSWVPPGDTSGARVL